MIYPNQTALCTSQPNGHAQDAVVRPFLGAFNKRSARPIDTNETCQILLDGMPVHDACATSSSLLLSETPLIELLRPQMPRKRDLAQKAPEAVAALIAWIRATPGGSLHPALRVHASSGQIRVLCKGPVDTGAVLTAVPFASDLHAASEAAGGAMVGGGRSRLSDVLTHAGALFDDVCDADVPLGGSPRRLGREDLQLAVRGMGC